ncbi:MAG: HPr family phosphocarrier protein [Planctomycetota bacterium]
MTISRSVTLINRQGLHARPIQRIVEICRQNDARVRIARGALTVDGRSILEMLTLAAPRGTVLQITVEGPDEQKALDELVALIDGKFGED